jgi:hypothetical protein
LNKQRLTFSAPDHNSTINLKCSKDPCPWLRASCNGRPASTKSQECTAQRPCSQHCDRKQPGPHARGELADADGATRALAALDNRSLRSAWLCNTSSGYFAHTRISSGSTTRYNVHALVSLSAAFDASACFACAQTNNSLSIAVQRNNDGAQSMQSASASPTGGSHCSGSESRPRALLRWSTAPA